MKNTSTKISGGILFNNQKGSYDESTKLRFTVDEIDEPSEGIEVKDLNTKGKKTITDMNNILYQV